MFPLIKASRQQPKIPADKMTPKGDMKPIVTPLIHPEGTSKDSVICDFSKNSD